MKKMVLFILGIFLLNPSFSQGLDSLIDLGIRIKINELKVGDSIPKWGVIPIDKREWIPLKDMFRENVVLIEFWFTHCQYCIKSIPKLNELYTKYNNKGLKIIYANAIFNEGEKEIFEFKKKHNILFEVYKFGNIFEQGSLPTFILIDKTGIIKYKIDGYPDDLIGDIEKIIN